ncbi:MAG: sodium:proton antiporter [Saprospiraceae bacterium]
MDVLTIIAALITLSALFGYINARFLKLPDTIGLMVVAILFTLFTVLTGTIDPSILEFEKTLIHEIDFKKVLLDGFLSILLFAGALHTDFDRLKKLRWPIIMFSTLGVLVSTFLIGGGTYLIIGMLGFSIPFIHCLLFGALISPTDPIAVLGILKKAGVPKGLETKIVGESLFNDGVGVVVFATIYGIAEGGGDLSFQHIGFLFLEEVGGGILLGFALGWVTYQLMKSIDNYQIEVLITLAMVLGGYWLASSLHFSGPLAMVVAGLMVGHERFRTTTMSEITELYVDKFWELLDVLFNAILFVLIGMELLIITFNTSLVVAGMISVVLVLVCRYLALALPLAIFKKKLDFAPHTGLIMTWGGLRGGISIALALSLTPEMSRDVLLTITYVVVVFSIVVQGLTVGNLVKKLGLSVERAPDEAH